jgi:hypothetical protein
MQRHTEMVEKQGGPSNRDDLLSHRYVRILERKIRRSVYELDDDDAISIGLWVENNQDCVFFYEDFSDTDTTPTLAFFFSFLFSKFLRLDHKTCFFWMWPADRGSKAGSWRVLQRAEEVGCSAVAPIPGAGSLAQSLKQEHYVSDTGDVVYYQAESKTSTSAQKSD